MRVAIFLFLLFPWVSFSSLLPTITAQNLALYNGQNDHKAYIALNGYVYDVSSVRQWRKGNHGSYPAGIDLTPHIQHSPHGADIILQLELVPIAIYKP